MMYPLNFCLFKKHIIAYSFRMNKFGIWDLPLSLYRPLTFQMLHFRKSSLVHLSSKSFQSPEWRKDFVQAGRKADFLCLFCL